MKKILNYYKMAREELIKVVLPTKQQVRSALISVILVVIVVALFLGLVDFILSASVSKILK